ncbi:hypothetical protein DL764_007186 [Monosporascus ibericus]|uniref:Uncharacterized protein n=1 Tax=Monosporascus ibericus TaxID=155417 RepID=A0A4Q4T354_9PEZI|nr:hypothetical protein DL764_007186 [Monosporascus ibericus]
MRPANAGVRSSSETISDSEPEPTVLELELQKENEGLRAQLEQLGLSNEQEMARREIIPNSQPARAAEELERQKADLAARNAELVEQDAELRRLLETASDEKAALETEVERLRQRSEDSAARARDAATAREDFEKRYLQAQQDFDAYDVRLRQGIEHSREIADHVAKERELRATWLKEADGHTETKKQLREAKEKVSAQGEALRDADETRERLRGAESRLMEKEFSLAQALRQLEVLGITAEELQALRLRLRQTEPPSRRVPGLELQVQQLSGQLRNATASSGALAERLQVKETELTEAKAWLEEGLKREETLVTEAKKADADHTRAVEALEGSLSALREEVTGKNEAVGGLQEANRQLEESRGQFEAEAHALTETLRRESAKVQSLQAELAIGRHNVASRGQSLASTQAELREESAKVKALQAELAIERHNISSRDQNLAELKGELSSERESVNALRGAGSLLQTDISAFLTLAFGPGPPTGYPRAVFDIFAAVARGLCEPGGPPAAAYLAKDHLRDAILQTCPGKDPHKQCLLMFAYRELNLRAQALFGKDPEDPVVTDLHKGFRTRGADLLALLDQAVCAVDRRDQGAVADRLAVSCGDRLRVIGDFALLAEVDAGEFVLLDLKRRTVRTIEKCLAGIVDDFPYIGPVKLEIRSPRAAEWQEVVFEKPHWRVEAWWRKFMYTYD